MTIFSNPGEIDPRSFTTFGVNVKPSDHPIGRFGTGLKYAIAVLLRHRRKITITSGGETYTFTTKTVDFRGEETTTVCCNGEELGYTTHLGHHWELWQAYRELASNAIDEGGEVGEAHTGTVIEAELDDINYHDVFFNPDNPIMNFAYLQWIRVYESSIPFMFPCHLPLDTQLTEDRTVRYTHETDEQALNNLLLSDDQEKITSCLLGNYAETNISYLISGKQPASPVFVETISSLQKESKLPATDCVNKLVAFYVPKETQEGVEFTPPQEQREIVDEAVKIVQHSGYDIKWPIVFQKDLPRHVLAEALHREIILSQEILRKMNVTLIVEALIEECAHLEHGFRDCERDFQTWIFSELAAKCTSIYRMK